MTKRPLTWVFGALDGRAKVLWRRGHGGGDEGGKGRLHFGQVGWLCSVQELAEVG